MEELDHTPDTSFERDVVCEDEEAFCLSQDNIVALQTLLQQVCCVLRQCCGCCRAVRAGAGLWRGCVSEHRALGSSAVPALRAQQAQAALIPAPSRCSWKPGGP